MSRPELSLTRQAAHRELAVLVDGPWAPCWYWRDDLEAQQASARRMHEWRATAQLDPKVHYQPAEQWVDPPTSPRSGAVPGATSPR